MDRLQPTSVRSPFPWRMISWTAAMAQRPMFWPPRPTTAPSDTNWPTASLMLITLLMARVGSADASTLSLHPTGHAGLAG